MVEKEDDSGNPWAGAPSVVLGVGCGRIGVAGGEAEFGNCRPEGAAVPEDWVWRCVTVEEAVAVVRCGCGLAEAREGGRGVAVVR